MRRTQRCVDDDPACDFDGGTPGGCTFHVRVCAGNTDLVGCTPPASLASWELSKPSSQQAARHPELAVVRTAFAGVPAAITGVSGADVCSTVVDVVVPLRGGAPNYGTGKVMLTTSAAAVVGPVTRTGSSSSVRHAERRRRSVPSAYRTLGTPTGPRDRSAGARAQAFDESMPVLEISIGSP